MHFPHTMLINPKKTKKAKFIDVVSVWRFEKDHFLHFPGQNQKKFKFSFYFWETLSYVGSCSGK